MDKKEIIVALIKRMAAGILFISCFMVSAGISQAAFEEAITTGARSQGMGEAFCGIGGDASGILVNPAGIGFLEDMQVSFTGSFPYMGLLENDSIMNNFVVFSTPLPARHSVGVGLNFLGSQAYGELVVFGSYAYRPLKNLSLGMNLKYLSWDSARSQFYTLGELDEEHLGGTGIGVDAGLMYKPVKEVGVGLALTNVNQPNIVSLASRDLCTDVLPIGMRAGFSFSLFDFLCDFDYIYNYHSAINRVDSFICMGTERDLGSLGIPVTLRGGATLLGMGEGINMSLGASYKQTEGFAYRVDYAMVVLFMESAMFTHRFSFTVLIDSVARKLARVEEEMRTDAEETRRNLEEEARIKAGEESTKETAAEPDEEKSDEEEESIDEDEE